MAWDYVYTNGYPTIDIYNNAQLIYDYLTGRGVTPEATCAIIANMQSESGLNPGQWQHDYTVGDWSHAGFGLGQWTPASKISNYVHSTDPDVVSNGDTQLAFLLATPSQWSTYYITPQGYSSYYGQSGVPYFSNFSSFLASNDDAGDLAVAYMICWERPNNQYADPDTRRQRAEDWYTYFGGTPTSGYLINITVYGNGTAWASLGELVRNRAEAGQRVGLAAVAGEGDYFQLWTVDYPSSLTLDEPITVANNYFTMPASKVNLTAHFTGDTPIPPDPPIPEPSKKRHRMPIWMYPCLRI